MTRPARVAALLAAACSACAPHVAPPKVERAALTAQVAGDAPRAFGSFVHDLDRILRIGDRLRQANAETCGEKRAPDLGWITWAARDVRPELQVLAKQVLDVGKTPVVVAVSPDGAAALAGVRVGDHVSKVGGTSVATAVQVRRAEQSLPEHGATVTVERGGAEVEVVVAPQRLCRQAVEPSGHDSIDAWAYEGNVFVTLRLVALASDDQLAFSLAHALAVSLLNADGRLVHEIPEPQATSLAVQLTERAGFSVADAAALLELQAIEQPWMVITDGKKPEIGEIPRRIVALRSLAAERQPKDP